MTAWNRIAAEYNEIVRNSGLDEWEDVTGEQLRADVADRVAVFIAAVDSGDPAEIRPLANDLNEIIVAAMGADY